jgi:hypothetical protein
MENEHVISALVRLHAQIGGKIKANKSEATRLVTDMKHVEAVLHMIQPDFNARKIAAKRQTHANPLFKRRSMWPLALGVLRSAPEPMTAREIAKAMLATKGIETPTYDQWRSVYGAISPSLRHHVGRYVDCVGEGMPKRWRVIG